MTRRELIAKIVEDTGASKAGAAAAADSMIDGITRMLKEGEPISVPGSGARGTGGRHARTPRNPSRGAAILIRPITQ